jgi:hypothetical protein
MIVVVLLSVITAELGFICAVGAAIFAFEMYSMWLRWQAIKEEQKLTKIHLSPEQMKSLLGGKGLPLDQMGDEAPTDVVKASGQYL